MRVLLAGAVLLSAQAWAQPSLGAAVQVTPQAGPEGQAQARLVATPTGFWVVWQAGVGRQAKVRAARLGLDGVSLDPAGLTVSEGLGGRFEPSVAWGHGVALAVWSDMRSGHHEVYAARVDASGQVLDADGFALSEAPSSRMADVVATPTGFLAVWAQAATHEQGTEVWARALGPDGRPTAAPVALTTAREWKAGEDFAHRVLARAYAQHVRVTLESGVGFVVWEGNPGSSQDIQVARALVDPQTAAVLAPAAIITTGFASRVHHPALAGQGDGGVIVSWTDERGRGELGLANHNALLTAPEADAGVTLLSLKAGGGAREVLVPSVAGDGLVAFVQGVENPQRDRRKEWWVRVRRVGDDGADDVTVPEQGAWPQVATGATGVSLLVMTTVNAGPDDSGRLVVRVVSGP